MHQQGRGLDRLRVLQLCHAKHESMRLEATEEWQL